MSRNMEKQGSKTRGDYFCSKSKIITNHRTPLRKGSPISFQVCGSSPLVFLLDFPPISLADFIFLANLSAGFGRGLPPKRKKQERPPGLTRGIHASSHVFLFPPGFHRLVCSQRNLQDLEEGIPIKRETRVCHMLLHVAYMSISRFAWMWLEMLWTRKQVFRKGFQRGVVCFESR